MKYSQAALACLMAGVVAGCAALPTGFSSRSKSSIKDLFTTDEIDVATNQARDVIDNGSMANDSGLRIKKSERGNMKSYVVRGQRYHTLENSNGYSARGLASWYGPNFHGQVASNGETYDMYKMTAAHKTLPLPTYARVTHIDSKKSIVVKINDRGPFSGDRLIDLSFAAALQLGIVNDGTAMVDIEALTPLEVAELSGPDNKWGVDFYTDETVKVAAKVEQPVKSASLQQEQLNGTDITSIQGVSSASAVAGSVAKANSDAVEGELLDLADLEEVDVQDQIVSGQSVAAAADIVMVDKKPEAKPAADVGDDEIKVLVNSEATPEVRRAAGLPVDLMDNTSGGQPVSLSGIGAIQTANQANQVMAGESGVSVPLADLGNSESSDAASALESSPGYFIQAGVFADVGDAEKVAVDVVLAVPLEEVHVKPLKGSAMYRITVGPIIAADHAAEVSGKLDEAGVDNFTVKVKSIQ